MTDRIARIASALVVAGLTAAAAVPLVAARTAGWEDPIDFGGSIELYADDAIVVLTSVGLREVRLTPETGVTEVRAPADATALRPGRLVAVAGDALYRHGPLVAHRVYVWGPPQ